MPRLFKRNDLEQFECYLARVRVSDVAQYDNCHPSTVQCLRDRYKATGKIRIDTGLVNQE